MDYIDRLKRAAIPLGTTMVISSGAALAQDQLAKADLVQLAVTLGVYDNRCEKLAPRLPADLQRMVRMLDKGDVICSTAPPLLRHAYGMWHLPCAKNIDEDAFDCVLSTLPRAAAEFWRV
jgi:hypothetical protein